ncbi:MAG: patatin-like phospholipase family protein [Zoogloeaceae bacterium]|jgi:NTE family protein|nr:patatin-like phospholipase family protein [Zoogloeaceae bacterium]
MTHENSPSGQPDALARPINIGLQGGGAHGAYTWGVLDALLDDPSITYDGLSGTSAGAMNAIVLANGLMKGGRQGAKAALADFWRGVADSVPMAFSIPSAAGQGVSLLPSTRLMLSWTRYLSPYQLNPMDFNPLRDLLEKQVDFEALRANSPVHLFISATNANTGKLRLFRNEDITIDAVLASACLPMVHKAIEIDGQPYWDGGYSANPAVFPLFYECAARDILLVLLAPDTYEGTPKSADEIRARTMELAFNTSLLREMLLFANVMAYNRNHAEEAASSWLGSPGLRRLFGTPKRDCNGFEQFLSDTRFHLIEADVLINQFGSMSKMVPDWHFLTRLHDIGYTEAQKWLAANSARIGEESTVDIVERFGVSS